MSIEHIDETIVTCDFCFAEARVQGSPHALATLERSGWRTYRGLGRDKFETCPKCASTWEDIALVMLNAADAQDDIRSDESVASRDAIRAVIAHARTLRGALPEDDALTGEG